MSPEEQSLRALGPIRAHAGCPGYYGCVDIRKMINKPMEDDEANKGWMTLGMDMRGWNRCVAVRKNADSELKLHL